jgi:DNA-binding winged helix-turn-helix (wHTH) protein
MMTHSQVDPALFRENRPIRPDNSPMIRDWSNPGAVEATIEFGRFRVLLRQRQLVADGAPIEMGTRALDLLLVLLEANGSLVSKDELFSRVWPGIVVSEANLKVQISALRRALGDDRDFIRTEVGRGYRFTAAVRSIVARGACQRPTRPGRRSSQRSLPRRISRRPPRSRRVSRSLWQTFLCISH